MIYYTENSGENLKVEIKNRPEGDSIVILPDGRELLADCKPLLGNNFYSLLLDNRSYEAIVELTEDGYQITLDGVVYQVSVETERAHRFAALTAHSGTHSSEVVVKAPMPGLVSQVAVEAGQTVEMGQRLLILEAMKMENEIRAPRAGVVKTVHVQSGQTIEQNKPLLVIE